MFCNYKVDESQSLPNVLGSFIQQLFHNTSLPEDFHTFYSKYSSSKSIPSEDLFCLLGSLLDQYRIVYIVIDALYEYQQSGRRKFIDQLLKLSGNMHLLCTSRHLGDIADIFQGASRLEIWAREADILTYLHAQILEADNLEKFCRNDPSLQRYIVGKIVEKADGM